VDVGAHLFEPENAKKLAGYGIAFFDSADEIDASHLGQSLKLSADAIRHRHRPRFL
jgi:hypothetical protein